MTDKNTRRMLWLGKFAFPEIDTKATRVILVPSNFYQYIAPLVNHDPVRWVPDPFPYAELKTEKVDLKKWVYKGKHRTAVIRMGYSWETDTLIVSESSFIYD